jgi:hypothetical protein
MKARFVGDPNDGGSGPDVLTHWGVEFQKGKWTDVGSDARFAQPLRTSSSPKTARCATPARLPQTPGTSSVQGRSAMAAPMRCA